MDPPGRLWHRCSSAHQTGKGTNQSGAPMREAAESQQGMASRACAFPPTRISRPQLGGTERDTACAHADGSVAVGSDKAVSCWRRHNMIEFQYFEGCPNSTDTLSNLRELISEGMVDEREVRIVQVQDPDLAERVNFQGSPPILVNGMDIYTEAVPSGSSFSCRVYKIGGRCTGVLSKDYIRQKIGRLTQQAAQSHRQRDQQ